MKITYISRAKFGKFTAAIAAAALLAGTARPACWPRITPPS